MKKSNTHFIKSTKGITLIALVITIIVLIILAGISINLILGDNGIIQRANEASLKQDMATVYEDLQQKLAVNYIDYSVNQSDGDYIQYLISNNYISTTDDNTIYLVNVTNLLGYSLKSGNGSYNNDNVYKNLYIIEVTTNDVEKELSLYYYDKNGTSNYIGSLGKMSNTNEEEISSLPSDFWVITSAGEISINHNYMLGIGSGDFRLRDGEGNYITELSIPKQVNNVTVSSISSSCFSGLKDVTKITIPNSVTSIGDYAFKSCSKLTTINIPNGVTSIGNSAFLYCSGLTTINIPDSVTSIGDSAFDCCNRLTTINIPDGITSIGNSVFYACYKLTSITIPDSVTSIGNYAFKSCNSLTSITIPDSVSSIGSYAFSSCRGLTTITIPNTITSIGDYIFEYCNKLTTITIPNGVTSIGRSAFSSCSNLTTITIPDSVTSIGNYAFYSCSGLSSITIKGYANQSEFDEAVSSGEITLGSNWKPTSTTLIFEK